MVLTASGTSLPSPTGIQVDDEIIWSSDSGRDLSGLFSGDVVAQKKTVNITWEYLTASEVSLISNLCCAGYFALSFTDAGGTVTISSYRGTLSKVVAGEYGGTLYYKSVTCKVVQL